MGLSNAERQRRFIAKLKARAAEADKAVSSGPLKAPIRELEGEEVLHFEAKLAAAQALVTELKAENPALKARVRDLEAQIAREHIASQQEQARREEREPPPPNPAEPEPELASLPKSYRQKYEALERRLIRRLENEFEQRVLAEARRRLDEMSLPQYAKELKELERSISSRKGIMDRTTYRKILSCLHVDRLIQLLNIPSQKLDPNLSRRYDEAFRLFTELEKRVLDEKESPTQFRKMPSTYEELMAMKAKVQAERRAKRASKMTVR